MSHCSYETGQLFPFQRCLRVFHLPLGSTIRTALLCTATQRSRILGGTDVVDEYTFRHPMDRYYAFLGHQDDVGRKKVKSRSEFAISDCDQKS